MPMTRRRFLPSLAVLATGASAFANPALPAGVSDGVWQASIEPGREAVVLRVRRHGATPEEIVNARFLPPSVGRADGEWQVTGLTLARQRLTVVLKFAPRPGPGGESERSFEFDLSQRTAPLVRHESVDRRGGRYDVFRFDLAAREARRCSDLDSPGFEGCTPVVEAMRPRTEVDDVGLAAMPSAEEYAPPTVRIVLYGAPPQPPVPLSKPGR